MTLTVNCLFKLLTAVTVTIFFLSLTIIITLIIMQPIWLLELGCRLQFKICLNEFEDILDYLFFLRLELEAGKLPPFSSPPPYPTFDPMKTIKRYGDPITFAHYAESTSTF